MPMKAILIGTSALLVALPAAAQERPAESTGADQIDELVVTARRREERAQDVPIALSVIGGERLERSGFYNIAQAAQFAPSLQVISTNPRNTTLNIRGLGNNPALANDGLEPGVGFYVDQVYFSRAAAATFDLLDVERVEVLRGPQGTLFGKNTTAGAISVTTRAPTFDFEARGEGTVGDHGFFQGKASVSGALAPGLAGRAAISATRRHGFERNVLTGADVNDQNNLALRGQALIKPGDGWSLRLSGDYNRQELDCCYVVFAGVAPTLRPPAARFPALAAGLGYAPPSQDPFDRLTDANSPVQANQEIGGVSAIGEIDLGRATLTAVAAWREWRWRPANDGDFSGLTVLTRAENANDQDQQSFELRIASNGAERLDYVLGVYAYRTEIQSNAAAQFGSNATHFLVSPALPAALLDGYLQEVDAHAVTRSYAAFGQATWQVAERLKLTTGLRYTYEDKDARYEQTVSGGLATTVPALLAVKLATARPQRYQDEVSDGNFSGLLNLAYQASDKVLVYGNASRGYKSGGVNLSGLPNDAAGLPRLDLAEVDPERVTAFELGFKSELLDGRLTANLAVFHTVTRDYQANVVDTSGGTVLRYLDNIEKVRSQGAELDLRIALAPRLNGYLSVAWTDAEYVDYPNGPCPLELTGGPTPSCDLSGRPLPGVSRWAVTWGGEWTRPVTLGARSGDVYAAFDAAYRSRYFSDAADSRYMAVGDYAVVNARLGLRIGATWDVFVFAKNLFDEHYLTAVAAQVGNAGALYANLGDPRTIGLTVRVRR
ncbi:MAG: TonB-dependent receptor [Phenylobacterium sp.]|nr:MAG: TonB-dependent receptor [Phenylobacterium sp.]